MSKKLLFGLIYRPPRVEHPKSFFDAIRHYLPSYKHLVITGDFNANMNVSDHFSKPIYDFINSNSLFLVPSESTCHKSVNGTWLDLFITTCKEAVLEYSKSDSPL